MDIYFNKPTTAVRWMGTQPTSTNPPECIAISIVSNSRLLCEGLLNLLNTQLSVMLLNVFGGGNFADAAAALTVEDHVVLIDGGLGKDAAAAWTRFWRHQDPATRVIVFELADAEETRRACIEAGANGYTLLGATVRELAEAIRGVQGEVQRRSPDINEHVFTRINRLRTTTARRDQAIVPITPRELEVLACVADGLSNQEIASQLVIEVRTVKHHMHNIFDKLQVRSRWQAARVARDQNWLPSPQAIRA